MRFDEIGQQLRAFRMESGMRAEEIAARLGVSRAALYRYEKGEVIKLDTVKRLAELLKVSPLSLLGIGVEYYNRPIGYFERLRQLEETADQIVQVLGPVCFLTTTSAFETAVATALDDLIARAGADGRALRSQAEQVAGVLAARRRSYAARRPGIIAMIPAATIQRVLQTGFCAGLDLTERTRRLCRDAARTEAENLARLMEAEPMGLQFAVLPGPEPTAAFKIIRARDRATLAANPFRADGHPTTQAGVAMITSADEAVTTHQRVAETCWREALKGAAAAAHVRELIGTAVAAAA